MIVDPGQSVKIGNHERRVVARLVDGRLSRHQPCASCGQMQHFKADYIASVYAFHATSGTDPLTTVFLCDVCLPRFTMMSGRVH
jgi:hypothetical protein